MSKNNPNLLALVDVDNTLVSSSNELNADLVRDLKSSGIKNICLFTNMSAKTLSQEDTVGKNTTSLTRHQLVQKLRDEGFTVHAVITPIDPFYKGKSQLGSSSSETKSETKPISAGAPYKELLERQYERRSNELKTMELDQFAEDPEYKMTRIIWDYYSARETLINGLVKCEDNDDYNRMITYLDHQISTGIQSITTLQETNPTEEIKGEITPANILALYKTFKIHLDHVKALSLLKPADPQDAKAESELTHEKKDTEPKQNFNPAIPDAVATYISYIDWVKELPWINKLLNQGRCDPWDKGSMHACVTDDPYFAKFNGFFLFDDKPGCLQTVKKLHTTSSENRPLYCVKVNPQFKDPNGYYKDQLSDGIIVAAIMQEVNDEISDLLKRKNAKGYDDLSKEDKQRYSTLAELQAEVKRITNSINNEDKKWKRNYKDELKNAIDKSLASNELEKYSSVEKCARNILNLVALLSCGIIPVIKYGVTGTWFFSKEGKSKDAVLKMQGLAGSIEVKEEKTVPASSPVRKE